MNEMASPQSENDKTHEEREPYEAPAIIYEDLITTSSQGTKGTFSDTDVDPDNIFKGDGG